MLRNIIFINGDKYVATCDGQYNSNNQPVISIDEIDGEPGGVISVCIPYYPFKENETAICGDVPQLGVVMELVRVGMVENTKTVSFSGYGTYPVVKIISQAN
jgi:hypothetical protein